MIRKILCAILAGPKASRYQRFKAASGRKKQTQKRTIRFSGNRNSIMMIKKIWILSIAQITEISR